MRAMGIKRGSPVGTLPHLCFPVRSLACICLIRQLFGKPSSSTELRTSLVLEQELGLI